MADKSTVSCRGCLTQVYGEDYYSLAFKEIKDLFVDCTSIEILADENKGFPRQLCSDCYSKCEQWQTFKSMCEELNEKLHDSIQERISGQDEEHPTISIKEEVMDTDCEGNFEVKSTVIIGEVFKEEEKEEEQEEDHEGDPADKITDKASEQIPFARREHLKEYDSEKHLECFVNIERIACSPVVNSSVMTLHMNDNEEDQPGISKETFKLAECPVCKEETDQLLEHLTTVHLKPGQKECPVCMKNFAYPRAHLVVHTNERPFPCSICDKSFNFSYHRLRHWKTKHQDKESLWKSIKRAVFQPKPVVVECPICHKSFQGLADLHNHFVVHTDERPYICNYCNLTSRYKSIFHKHIRCHHPNESVEKGVSIKEGSIFENTCPWEAMGYFDIKRLTLEEAKNLPSYTCKTCGKVCRSPSKLIEHSLVHTGEKPFNCVYCPAEFTLKISGLNHVSKYHPKKPLKVVLKKDTRYAKDLAKLKKRVPLNKATSKNEETLAGYAVESEVARVERRSRRGQRAGHGFRNH